MQSSPAGNTTTTTNSNPWSGQAPYLGNIYTRADRLVNDSVPQYYPGNTYASMTPAQQGIAGQIQYNGLSGGSPSLQAADQFATNAMSPNYTAGTQGAFDQGQGVLSNEMSSSYLDPNNSPAYQTAVSNAIAGAVPAATAGFVGGNRSSSGLASAAASSAAANAAGGLAQSQYQANQNIQNAAASQAANNFLNQQGNQTKMGMVAPMIDQARMGDLGTALSSAGLTQQDQQNQISADMARFNYNQMQPWNQLGLYEGAITGTGSPGGTSTSSQPYFQNQGAGIMSGLSGLGSMAMMASMIPW